MNICDRSFKYFGVDFRVMVLFIVLIVAAVLLAVGAGITFAMSLSLEGLTFGISMGIYLAAIGFGVVGAAMIRSRIGILIMFFLFVGAVLPFVFGWV